MAALPLGGPWCGGPAHACERRDAMSRRASADSVPGVAEPDEVTASSQDGLQVLAAPSLDLQDLATLRGPKIPLRLAWFKGESMQKRLLGAASLVGVAALLMSACGGSTPTPAATGDAAATTTTPAATSTTTGAPVRDA